MEGWVGLCTMSVNNLLKGAIATPSSSEKIMRREYPQKQVRMTNWIRYRSAYCEQNVARGVL